MIDVDPYEDDWRAWLAARVRGEDRSAIFLPNRAALIGTAAADLGLDLVE
jgi:hypothetical protein